MEGRSVATSMSCTRNGGERKGLSLRVPGMGGARLVSSGNMSTDSRRGDPALPWGEGPSYGFGARIIPSETIQSGFDVCRERASDLVHL